MMKNVWEEIDYESPAILTDAERHHNHLSANQQLSIHNSTTCKCFQQQHFSSKSPTNGANHRHKDASKTNPVDKYSFVRLDCCFWFSLDKRGFLCSGVASYLLLPPR